MGYNSSRINCFNTQPPEGGCERNKVRVKKELKFQHTAARRRLLWLLLLRLIPSVFQHTAARRRLDGCAGIAVLPLKFQHTAARRRLSIAHSLCGAEVKFQHTAARRRLSTVKKNQTKKISFNTQPPEGGWRPATLRREGDTLFQHTAARRRLVDYFSCLVDHFCFNTQPPEGGCAHRQFLGTEYHVSTHSRPKAAENNNLSELFPASFNTQPPEGGWGYRAARRYGCFVSTHSRPKAAEPLLKALFHQVSQPRFR